MEDTSAWLTSCLLVHCVGQVDITASRPHLLWHKPTPQYFHLKSYNFMHSSPDKAAKLSG